REEQLAQEHAEAAINVSAQHGLVLYEAMATITWSWALIEQGPQDEAIEQMRRGLAAYQGTGTEVIRPHFLALLAQALDKSGKTEEALRVVEKAGAVARSNGERYYQSELYRLKGELLLKQSTTAMTVAEACFHQSIKTAQEQKAKSLELRAVASLARLHQTQGRQ